MVITFVFGLEYKISGSCYVHACMLREARRGLESGNTQLRDFLLC